MPVKVTGRLGGAAQRTLSVDGAGVATPRPRSAERAGLTQVARHMGENQFLFLGGLTLTAINRSELVIAVPDDSMTLM